MAKKILTTTQLENDFDCIINHSCTVSGQIVTINDEKRECSAQRFFTEGLPSVCPTCGSHRPSLGSNPTPSQIKTYREALTWTCSNPECGEVVSCRTTLSMNKMGLIFTNGTTASTRLIAEGTITTPQDFRFNGVQSTTTKVFAPQYIQASATGSGWSDSTVELVYNGSQTIQFTKTSGGTDMSIKAVYNRTENGNKYYKIQLRYNCWVASYSSGKPSASNNQYFRYNISVADSTTVLTLNIEKSGHNYINEYCSDRYRTLWVDGFVGSFVNFQQQYNTWSRNHSAAGLNGLGVGNEGVLPVVYLPDYATKSSPTGLPIIVNNKSCTADADCSPVFYDCSSDNNYCGVIQYYFFPYNTSWDNYHVANPIAYYGSAISPRLTGGEGPFTAQGCSSVLYSFFNSTSSGGAGYHYGDNSLENPKLGWIMINPAVLQNISTWTTSGVAIMLVMTGMDIGHPKCQMQNSIIKLVKNNTYYVLN